MGVCKYDKVILVRDLAAFDNLIEFGLSWRLVDKVSVLVKHHARSIGKMLFAGFLVGFSRNRIKDEWFEVSVSDVSQVTVNIREQAGLLRHEDGLLALAVRPTDERGHLPALTNTCLVADNHSLALLHLIDSHSHTINLLSGKSLVKFFG